MAKDIEKIKTILYCAITALLILVVGLGGVIVYYGVIHPYKNPGANLQGDINNNPIPTINQNLIETPAPGEIDISAIENAGEITNRVFSIMFLGYDQYSDRGPYDGTQTDTIIVCTVNLDTNAVHLLSIPRDTRAYVKKLDKNGETTKVVSTKINAAFNMGGTIYGHGAENTVDTVSRMLQVPMQYYVLLNMYSIAPLTEAIGGVTVNPLATMEQFNIYKGQPVVLKGEAALMYVRLRKLAGTDGSDLGRTQRQRQFIIEAAKQIKQSDPLTLLKTLYAMTDYYKTNLSYSQLISLASLMKRCNMDSIESEMLDGQSNGEYYIYDSEWLNTWRNKVYCE